MNVISASLSNERSQSMKCVAFAKVDSMVALFDHEENFLYGEIGTNERFICITQ